MVEFLTELHNTTVLEGEDATFKCVVSPDDVHLVWLMDNEPIALGDRYQATQNGLCHTLVIKKCQMLDCSKITAEAEGQISKAILKVQGKKRSTIIRVRCSFSPRLERNFVTRIHFSGLPFSRGAGDVYKEN